MARKFKCSHCSKDIIVNKHLWPGENTYCLSCGKEIAVPEDFETVQDKEYDKFKESKSPVVEQEMNEPASQVIVNDISMPFNSMVVFMIKWAIAAIPAMIILYLIGMSILFLFTMVMR